MTTPLSPIVDDRGNGHPLMIRLATCHELTGTDGLCQAGQELDQ